WGSPERPGSGRGDRASRRGSLHRPAEIADEEEMGELLRDAGERLEIVERVLAPLRVSRAQTGCGDLLDECCLSPGGGEDRAQVARVDPVASEPRASRSDVGLALAVDPLASFVPRHDEPELLELADEVG